MPYEIDFIGVKAHQASGDADAIAMRWKVANNNYKVIIYDGGYEAHGEELKNILEEYYFPDNQNKVIDAVIVSHPDKDHVSGLKTILESFDVSALYMNRPWKYLSELYDKLKDGRITIESLERRLKESYSFIAELEEIALDKGIAIHEAFEGEIIENKLTVLSPTKEFYLDLLVESKKSPELQEGVNNQFPVNRAESISEDWNTETLREDVETSAENEMSLVILGEMGDENLLLVGDAGIRALDKAIEYAKRINKFIKDTVKFMQIPHHGGRHNVNPSVLNKMIGEKVQEGVKTGKTAFVSVGENSDHPRKSVVNAYLRRGVDVYKMNGHTVNHSKGDMPNRDGWRTATKEEFNRCVEN